MSNYKYVLNSGENTGSVEMNFVCLFTKRFLFIRDGPYIFIILYNVHLYSILKFNFSNKATNILSCLLLRNDVY